MRFPARHAHLLFSALLSGVMVSIVTAIVLLNREGLNPEFARAWLHGFATTWPIAFPTVTVVAPLVRRFVDTVTRPVAVGTCR